MFNLDNTAYSMLPSKVLNLVNTYSVRKGTGREREEEGRKEGGEKEGKGKEERRDERKLNLAMSLG